MLFLLAGGDLGVDGLIVFAISWLIIIALVFFVIGWVFVKLMDKYHRLRRHS